MHKGRKMFSDANLPEPLVIFDIETFPVLTKVDDKDGIFFNDTYSTVRTIRKYVYDLLLKAKSHLPKGYNFIIYEAYRPKDVQIKLWENIIAIESVKNPKLNIDSEEFIAICDKFVANPYRQGSGHQSGAAIDVSLVDDKGIEYDMGGKVRGFDKTADFMCPEISSLAKRNRAILKNALEKVGMINYPSEWWHYSFGDRLWARLTGSKLAIFDKLDI